MSTLIEEQGYLKDLKFTHEKQIQKGKLYNAENTKKLIDDCEKRIEQLSKKKNSLLVEGVIWKPLKDWEDTHLISSDGKIKKKGFFAKGDTENKRFYAGSLVAQNQYRDFLKVILTDRKRTKRLSVANLVYENFIGDLPDNYCAKNKDGNILNNDYTNLYLVKVDYSPKKLRHKFA